jgi:glycosyltransferase involved in cell wall biosynthesis
MRVSIVIPVYNGANFLRDAIDSALAQTYDDVEVIVVNDGSTDGGATEGIARSYGNRIRYVDKPNGGVSSALNAGIRSMTGEWFSWLSHDDRYLPEKVAKQIEFAKAHPEAKIVCCNFEQIDDAGRVFDVVREPEAVLRNGREVLDTWIFGCALLIHRSCFDAAGLFNETNRTTQDLEMWLTLVEREPIHYMPDVLCQRRDHPAMGSRTEQRHERDKDELFAWMLDRYDAPFFAPATTPRERAEVFVWLSWNALKRGAHEGSREALKRAWREWPSPRNPALPRLAAGVRGYLFWRHVKAQTRSKWSWVRRVVGGR